MIRSDILPHRKNEQEEIHKMQEEIYMKKMMAFLGMLFVMAAASVAGAAEILRSRGITKGRIGVLMDVLPSKWKHQMLEYIPGLEFVDVSDQVFC